MSHSLISRNETISLMWVFIFAVYGTGASPNITKTGYSEPHLQSWTGGTINGRFYWAFWTRTLGDPVCKSQLYWMKMTSSFFFTHICQRSEEHFPCFSSISDFPSKWLNFVTMPQCKHRVSCCLWMGQKREESLSAKLLPNLFFFFFAKTFVQVSFQGCDSEMTGF